MKFFLLACLVAVAAVWAVRLLVTDPRVTEAVRDAARPVREVVLSSFTGRGDTPGVRNITGLGPETNMPETTVPASGAGESAWYLALTNKWNCIPEGFTVELKELDNGEKVDERIRDPLLEMFGDAVAGGVYPIVASGYRTAEEQQRLMDEKIAAYEAEGCAADEAKAMAEMWVALPGTSEHQLGLAVDINADGVHSAGREVYDWLEQNSYLYGFIRRYPEDKTRLTGVNYEPWHYRYVGPYAAREIFEREICLEEYLEETGGF